jgi:hypothetical protein
MSRSRLVSAACALCIALPALAIAQQPNVAPVPVGPIAVKLGVKQMPSTPIELELGRSATTILAEPSKLVAYGIKGMHEGARVTITCVGPNRVRVEADEMEPVYISEKVTLKVDADGGLTPVPDRPPTSPKPPR